jgi:hypothetical protein
MMRDIYHSNLLNPAFQSNYSVFLGIPGISSLQPNLGLRDFNLSDIIFNTDNLESALKSTNRIDFEFSENIISLGFITGKSGITFDFSQKMSYEFSFPEDAIVFWRNGNVDHVGKTMDFGGSYFSANWYLEYALGYSYQYNSKWTFGIRAKYLNGFINVTTKKWESTLYTEPDTADLFDLTIHNDIQLQVSAPLYIPYNNTGDSSVVDIDNVDIIKHDAGSILNNYLFYNKNRGFGIDLGAVYQPINRLTLSASIIDLGFIHWVSDKFEFTNSGDFTFQGIRVIFNNTTDSIDDNRDELIDTLKSLSKIHSSNKNYYSYLTPKLNIGASYRIYQWLDIGMFSKTVFTENNPVTSLTLSGNAELWKFLSASLSYTLLNYSPVNLGVGIGLKAGPVQLYFITDSMFGWRYDGNNKIIWPAYTRDFGFRFGLNLMFGRITGQLELDKTRAYHHPPD